MDCAILDHILTASVWRKVPNRSRNPQDQQDIGRERPDAGLKMAPAFAAEVPLSGLSGHD
jgi:hypothetical protein